MQIQLSETSWRFVKVLGGFEILEINELSISTYAGFT